MSSNSSPSANDDFPEPLRPAISVSPGPAGTSSFTGAPMPRKPPTSMEDRKTPRSSGLETQLVDHGRAGGRRAVDGERQVGLAAAGREDEVLRRRVEL